METLGWIFIVTLIWPFMMIGAVVLLAAGRGLFDKWRNKAHR